MRRRFFIERFADGRAELRGDAAHHLGRVLRAEPGQQYELSDGRGVWLAEVAGVRRGSIEFRLVEQLDAREPALRTTLLLSVVKFDRFEWALEKATELGVSEIHPLFAARSEKKLVAAAAGRAERWRRILLESAQQARLLRPPILAPGATPDRAFSSLDACAAHRILLSEDREVPPLARVLAAAGTGCKTQPGSGGFSAVLAIGPEGGWTDQELIQARAGGFQQASLGRNILRTETAVIAALAVLNSALAE
jgi:16S rRNA (uracil1498-N3)-methyltransferase